MKRYDATRSGKKKGKLKCVLWSCGVWTCCGDVWRRVDSGPMNSLNSEDYFELI